MADYRTIAGYKFYDYKKWPDWAVASIEKAIKTGIIRGKAFTDDPKDRIFDANAATTRAELATVVDRAGITK